MSDAEGLENHLRNLAAKVEVRGHCSSPLWQRLPDLISSPSSSLGR